MVRPMSCATYGGECARWGLTDPQHALTHALGRLIDQVASEDQDAGIDLTSPMSMSSTKTDSIRLEHLLEEEGYRLEPIERRRFDA